MSRILDYFKHPSTLGIALLKHFGGHLPDSVYLKMMFRLHMGRKLNLDHPVTYSENLQWLKLYDRRMKYTSLVDKSLVKEYVASVIGEEYIIPTLGVWNSPEEITWNSLPDQFVLKATNGGGNYGVVICRDKSSFDFSAAIRLLKSGMSYNLYNESREWPYKNIQARVIAEEFKEDSETKELRDYKFFCFDGVVKAMFVGTERQKPGEDVKFDFFDADYHHLPIKQGHEHAAHIPEKPKSFELMKVLASKLSQGIPHVRIDLYEVDGHPFFGEMTFYHFGGMVPFEPDDWDRTFGSWLVLPEKKLHVR